METESKQQRRKLRFALLIVGLVGLIGSTGLYFASRSAHKEGEEKAAAAATEVTKPETASQPRTFGITNVTIPDSSTSIDTATAPPAVTGVDAPEVAAVDAPPPVTKTLKHHSRANRNRIATRLPSNFAPAPDWRTSANGGQVEMWSGTQKRVVNVPPGAKYED